MKLARVLAIGVLIAVFILLAITIARVVTPRIVVSAVAPNGAQVCVFQELGGDLFNTAIYSKQNGEPWGWFYYDHEDNPWFNAHTNLDLIAKAILIYRDDRLVAKYYWESDELLHIARGTRRAAEPDTSLPSVILDENDS